MSPKRRYYKRLSNRDKYSCEQTNFITPSTNSWNQVAPTGDNQQQSRQFAIDIIPPSLEQGMRKVKHLTISMACPNLGDFSNPLFYAIVFVPQGYQPQTLTIPATGFAINNYQANQFIMSSGVLDFSGGPLRIRSPLSRNLNSGDSIYLILAAILPSDAQFLGQISYAITLQ